MEFVNFAADPRSFVTRQIDQAKQEINFIESNHKTKTDNLKSCVTLILVTILVTQMESKCG